MYHTTKMSLKDGIGLTCVTTKQSKTSCLSAMLALPLGAEGRSKSALLPYVLRSSSRAYPGRQAVAAQLDNLYGARLEPIVRKRGEAQLVGFVADVIDERFAMPGEGSLFAGTAQLLSALLLNPDSFDAETVSREAEQLCARIASLPDDKRSWAVRRMYQHMCAQEAYSAVELGDIDAVRAISPEELEAHYHSVIQTAPLELFYCGSLPAEAVAQQLCEAMQALPERKTLICPQFDAPCAPQGTQLRTVMEEEPVAQGKLAIGLRTGITAFDDDYPAMVLFNACFGGTTSSRLFRTVREQLSLCYYASSQTDKLKGVMAVSSGIENESEPKARAEILHQLEEMQDGVTADEVEAARRSVTASLRAMQDTPLSLENFYQTQAVAGLAETLDELIARIQTVTAEDVTRAARKAVPDTVYFLKGAGA
ncbi:EF-P 5-aminopentanol modification-associated protein YfmF [Butyricicoccus sp.]|uniref:EF-P 5-aminopentanol modification-associated protein YfmF n=1 Tax=Butyricicoccus sp. TaxID=2049021 RepID=UPI003F16F1C9